MSEDPSWMIYGAYGFMGQKLARTALSLGLKPVLAGRDSNKLAELSERLNLSAKSFALQATPIETWIKGQKLLINCASPFNETSSLLRQACRSQKIHYLDLSPELLSIESSLHESNQWMDDQLTIVSGLCPESLIGEAMAWKLKQTYPDLRSFSLEIYPSQQNRPTKGSLASAFEGFRAGTWSRRSGKMIASSFPGTLRGSAHKEDTLLMRTAGAELTTLWQSLSLPDIDSWRLAPLSGTWGINLVGKLLPLLKIKAARSWAIQKIIDFSTDENLTESGVEDFWFGEGAGSDGKLHWMTVKTENLSDLTARICLNLIRIMLSNDFPAGFRTAGEILGGSTIFELVSENSEVIMGGRNNSANEVAVHARSDDKTRK